MAYRGYVGRLGSGKTYSMVKDATVRVRKTGCQIVTNMAGLKAPEAMYIRGLAGIPAASNALVLFDEVQVAANARDWHSLSPVVREALSMARKNGVDFWWTAHTLDQIDKELRLKTDEIVLCRRAYGQVFQVLLNPGDKQGTPKPVHLDPRYFPLYDTLETIDREGVSSGRGAAALSVVARRRIAAEDTRRRTERRKTEKPLYRQDWRSLAFTRQMALELRPEAKAALTWLRYHERLDPAVPWAVQVRKELARREWLRLWAMTTTDVPDDCCPENPWLAGHSPEEVEERWREEKQEEAAAELISLATKGGRSSRASRSSAV